MKNKKTRNLIILISCLIFSYIIWLFVVPIKNIYEISYPIPDLIKGINKDINANDFISVNKKIYKLEERIIVLKNNLIFLKFLKLVPVVNKEYVKIEQSLSDVEVITENISSIIESSESIGKIDKNSMLISFLNNPDKFQEISIAFDSLSKNIESLTKSFKIDNYSIVSNIKLIAKVLEISKPISKDLLEITGQSKDKRYLLLLQNNTELRSTGGFIGTYGIMIISKGKIKDIFIDDIYHLDSQSIGKLKNEVPGPIKQYLKTEEWYMRDCNFQPDFPSAMRDCLSLYDLERKNLDPKDIDNKDVYENNLGEVDGVIALNPDVISEILKIIGNQEVGGILFENNNFTDDLQKAVELYYKERGSSHWDRKDIIGMLAKNILKDLEDAGPESYAKIMDVLISKLESKDILLYSKNQNIEQDFVKANWAGEVKSFDKDYLMFVDNNLASFKSDQFIDRTISYRINKNDTDDLVASIKVTYKHNGDYSWNSTKYRTYARILVPSGSEFISIEGFENSSSKNELIQVDKNEMYGKVSYGLFISVEPKQENSFIIKYKLPDYVKNQINNRKYSLFIQKQPGVKNTQFILATDFKEDFGNVKTNFGNIINSNLSSISSKKELNKDELVELSW